MDCRSALRADSGAIRKRINPLKTNQIDGFYSARFRFRESIDIAPKQIARRLQMVHFAKRAFQGSEKASV